MIRTVLLSAILIYLLLQIPGCHFYLDAVPRLMVSSERLDIPEQPPHNLKPPD